MLKKIIEIFNLMEVLIHDSYICILVISNLK